MNHLYHTALRLSILPILLFVLSVSCKEPTAPRTYTVTFETNKGTTLKPQTIKEGKKASQPDNPTREGYAFGGWHRDKALTQSFDFNTAITADITLYAKWNAITYTVSFQTNGGSPVTSITIAKGSTLNAPTPTKGKLTLLSWYRDNGLTQPFSFDTPIIADITLYAKYGFRIPDDNFRGKVKSIVPAAFIGDVIDTAHSAVTGLDSLDVSAQRIKSLAGIEYFTTLKALYCFNNQLTSLDVATNTALRRLSCDNNQLTTLDVATNTALTKLWCYNNKLTSLDVATNTALEGLYCFNNQLTSLDVATNTKLTKLWCFTNQLTSLDVATNTQLTELSCNNNQLTTLDVATNTKLTDLNCSDNQLTSLDVATNTALEGLYCFNNQLTSLDVSTNTQLTNLICSSNQLNSLDVATNTQLTELSCNNNQLTTLDVATNTALEGLSCFNNQLNSLDVATNTKLTDLICFSNQLNSLDVATNTKLTKLNCSDNQLNSLDVATNTALTSLYCYDNQLTSLDLRGMDSVRSLSINAGSGGKNLITSLRILDAVKDNNEIKEVKTNRGEAVTITTYNSDRTTVICNNYDPNQGTCLDP